MAQPTGSSKSLLAGVLPYFQGVKEYNEYYKALCPSHQDNNASLSIREERDPESGLTKVRLKCHAGCTYDDVLQAAGLERRELYRNDSPNRPVAIYDYVSPAGGLLHQTVRYAPKDFRQRRPDGKGGWIWGLNGTEPVLYNLPRVLQAILAGESVFIVEGEKDADRAIQELGVVATTCPMGAQKWRASYTQTLLGARVVLIPDNDPSGRKHMDVVGQALLPVAKSVKRLELPGLLDKEDLSDWIDAGGTREKLLALVDETPEGLFPADSQGIGEGFAGNKPLPAYTVGQIKEQSGGDNEHGWMCPLFMKAGEITLFGGEAKKSGKTTFYMHMLKAVHDGVPFMGMPTIQTNTLLLTEQGGNILEATTKAKIADDDRIFITPYKEVSREEWPRLIELAVGHCKENDLGALVIYTFTAFARLRGSDENLSGEIIARMEPVVDAARVHGLHVSILHHTGYNGEIRGSSAFWKDPDCIWLLKRPLGDHAPNVRALHGEGRYDTVNTGFNIALEDSGYTLLGTNSQIERARAKTALLKKIPKGKENGVRRTKVFKELMQDEGVSERTLGRALDELKDTGAVREEQLKGQGNPKILWQPPSVAVTATSPGGLFPADSQGIGTESAANKPEPPAFITDQSQLKALLKAAAEVDEVALDLETTGLDPRRDRIRLVSLATHTDTYIVDLYSVKPDPLFPVLAKKRLIAHNALFDLGFLAALGFEPKEVVDTMILSQLLHAGSKVEPMKRGQTSHSLVSVAMRELGLELDKTQQSSDWGSTLTPEMVEYAAKDVEVLMPLYETLQSKIEDAGLTYVAEIEHRALPAVVRMSKAGVPVDADGWREHARKSEADATRLEDELKALAPEHPDGKAWNFGSHQQVRKATKLLGVDLPDTKDETLALYAREHEFIAALRNYRKASKLACTYGSGWLENGYYQDGRIYASWRQLRAATGRMACDHPNLQNIPRSGPLRSFIRAPEGRVFIIADYSQIELRIAAKISGDQEMLSAYAEGRDLHTLTAQNLTGREEISKDERKLAKAVNFGLLYGMGTKGLQSYALKSYGIEMSFEEATLYRRRFFETYPGLKRWHEQERRAWQCGDVETRTPTGRRRTNVERLTDRLNTPVQGTGADGLKLALALLWERRDECPRAMPVIVCHDEIVVECDAEQAEEAKAWLEKAMIEGMDAILNSTGEAHVPVEVESRIVNAWGES